MSQVIYKDRLGTDCNKWDGCEEKFGDENLLPLWVADMDFEAPSCVKQALKEYVDFGVFGYYQIPNRYYEAFINWEKIYHDYDVKKEWIRFAPGVVPAFNWLIHILTNERDGVLITPPVYYPFKDAVVNNNRTLVESPLMRLEDHYELDYEDFERKIKEQNVKLFIFCTPHNPVGRVWKRDEIVKALDICKKYGVYVIADEIHQDIIMDGYQKVTAAATGNYDEIMVTLTAATKTFNLAGCQNSIVVIPNESLRKRYDDYLTRLRITGGNAFGYIAVQSAYEGGRKWLDEVLNIIEENYHLMKSILEEKLPKVWIPKLEGTYLMWIDLGAYVSADEIESVIQKDCGLAVDYGSWFGGEAYGTFIRVNLATREENIRLAAEKIVEALEAK
jgi:cystathionine beta-lyase